jgi:hypothetical protein
MLSCVTEASRKVWITNTAESIKTVTWYKDKLFPVHQMEKGHTFPSPRQMAQHQGVVTPA